MLAFALLMTWDNWRTGIRWESTGPQAGYFPFYVSLILAGACLYGLVREFVRAARAGRGLRHRATSSSACCRCSCPTLLYVPGHAVARPLRRELPAHRGLHDLWSGSIKRVDIARSPAFVFSVSMFLIFEVAFDVIMPKGPLERLFGY